MFVIIIFVLNGFYIKTKFKSKLITLIYNLEYIYKDYYYCYYYVFNNLFLLTLFEIGTLDIIIIIIKFYLIIHILFGMKLTIKLKSELDKNAYTIY